MTDPLFTPLKSHPSTWQAEVAQLRDENTDLILQAMASNGQAAEAHEARLLAEAEAKALRARVAELEEALRVIGHSDDHFGNWKGACQHRQRLARNALGSASHSAKSVPDQG